MKEVKFRAWDNYNRRWDYFSLPSIHLYIKRIQDHLLCGDEFYLFIGLHDKNGKEIWEGDILSNPSEPQPYSFVIEWNDDMNSCGCCFDSFSGVGFTGRILQHNIAYSHSPFAFSLDKSEVIGNIYENPELLGGENEKQDRSPFSEHP